MTRRERLQRCYFHQEIDRPAVYSRTGYPSDDPTYDRLKAFLAEYSELKDGWGCWHCETPLPLSHSTESYSEDFERQITILHTPGGDLRATSLKSLKGQPGLHETFFLKDRKDAETYLTLPDPEFSGDCSGFFEKVRAMGDRGIVEARLGRSPGGVVAELFGSETFAMMTITDRDIVHELCQREARIMRKRLDFLLCRKVGPFFNSAGEEYLVPPLHGPQDFQDFIVHYEKPIIDRVHEADSRIHVHSHGPIRHVFHGFLEMGVDVLHPFEGPPMGNITPGEAKKLARNRMTLEGNIQIHRFYENTPDEIREETRQLIADVFDDRKGLIVSSTASPFIRGQGEICFPQYKAMVETVLEK